MGLFSPRTFPEIMGDMISRLLAATPLTDVSFGGVMTTMLEAAAQEDDEQYFQMIQLIRAFSLDTTTGDDLDNRAFEFGITRRSAASATTVVTIGDSAFTKIDTSVFSGLPGAAAGSSAINGDSATSFPTAGAIVVGRGTSNAETVLYSSITDNGNYVTFNLSSVFANDHGTDETIILSQGGNRLVTAGTVVVVPASDTTENVTFITDVAATLLDGEDELTGVSVTASAAGTESNVPIGAINLFDSAPFGSATVRNPQRVTNGLDIETDQELRDRIKDTIQSLSRGTGRSITTGVVGLVSEDVNKRVVSVSLRDTTNPAEVVKLFIDDGTGFISTFQHVGFESLVSAATGGEKFLMISNVPVTKAFIETQNSEPYNIPNNSTLFVEVNGQVETIIFTSSDFTSPGAATAQEVLAKINSTSNLFESRVSSGGSKVRIFARASSDEEIQVTGGTSNTALNFPTDIKYTTKLYLERDHVMSLLSKDGRTASVESGQPATYDFSGVPLHLSVVVDGRTKNIQKVWFDAADFLIPATANILEVVEVLNSRGAGFSARTSSNDTKVTLSSNVVRSANSKIRVVEKFTTAFNEEGGIDVDRTTEFGDNTTSTTVFAANLDYIYLGHSDVPFDTVFVDLLTNASTDVLPSFEFYQGGIVNAFTQFGAYDTTLGLTQSGHILFQAPYDWAKTTVNAVSAYWIRIQRTQSVLPTAPVVKKLRICGANEQFEFPEIERAGTSKDYTLNRFVGQLELENTLLPGDIVTLGSYDTRAFLVSGVGVYAGLPGATLTVTVDGILQTTTFVSGDFSDPLNALPTEVAAVINRDIYGLTAEAIESNTRVRIQSDRINGGTLLVGPLSANTVLDFATDEVSSLVSHIPALESAVSPYAFGLNDTVVTVLEDDLGNSFTLPLFYQSDLTGVTSTSVIIDTGLNLIFPNNADLVGFDLEMTTGPQLVQRRTISTYVAATGTLTLSAPFGGLPVSGDTYHIIPVTSRQVVRFWNNRGITLISNSAEIRSVDAGTRVQIASLQAGELASVAVTGGPGNSELQFALRSQGVDGYKYYVGLTQLVQKTVDGVQNDSENFPGIRAAGVQVEVIEPVTIPVKIQLEITTSEGVSLASVTDNVKSAVSNYINRLPVGGDVILSEIVVQVKNVSGVFDAVIASPLVNIAVADNELARISESNVGVV